MHKIRKLSIITIIIITITSVWISTVTLEKKVLDKHNEISALVKYVIHGVIRINNNTNFIDTATNEGWPGSGTQLDPYLIQGYDIDAHGEKSAFYIGNTSIYFIVEFCYLHNSSSNGIKLYNVSHGTIFNNTCVNNWYGVDVSSSNNNSIENNTCSNNDDGIALGSSTNITIKNNNCSDNSESGILLYSSSSNIIENNKLSSNTAYGINLYSSSNYNIMRYNLISYNVDYGIKIYSESHNIIYNNSFYYNHGSLESYNSQHIQAYDDGTNNYWNTTSGYGNYWRDWQSSNPYLIDGSGGAKDYYPLANPPTVPELSINFILLIILIGILFMLKREIS